MPTLTLTDWLAVVAVAGLLLFNFGGTVTGWVKSLFNKAPATPSPAVELQTRFTLWLQMRSLPDLTPEAIKDLELLKNELLKWE